MYGVKIKSFPVHPGSGPRAQHNHSDHSENTNTHTNKVIQFRTANPTLPLEGRAASEQELQQSTFCPDRELEYMRITPLGFIYNRPGLLSAVCCKPPLLTHNVLMSTAEGEAAQVLKEEIISLLSKRAPSQAPFEPVDLKLDPLKIALLLALSTARQVSELSCTVSS